MQSFAGFGSSYGPLKDNAQAVFDATRGGDALTVIVAVKVNSSPTCGGPHSQNGPSLLTPPLHRGPPSNEKSLPDGGSPLMSTSAGSGPLFRAVIVHVTSRPTFT